MESVGNEGKYDHLRTGHQRRVRRFMQGCGQGTPESPTVPSAEERVSRVRMQFEEVLEAAEAMGVDIGFDLPDGSNVLVVFDDFTFDSVLEDHEVDINHVIKECVDVSVVNTGTLVAFGVPDKPFLKEVDKNNELKLKRGYINEHGKLVKPADHPKVDIGKVVGGLDNE